MEEEANRADKANLHQFRMRRRESSYKQQVYRDRTTSCSKRLETSGRPQGAAEIPTRLRHYYVTSGCAVTVKSHKEGSTDRIDSAMGRKD